MYKYRNYINLVVFVIIVFLSFNIEHNPFRIDSEVVFQQLVKAEDPLYKEIQEKRNTYEEEPHDAYIDKVWKKMPGRNGRVVDIDASYERMKKYGEFKEDLLVYKQVPPKITIQDLEPSPIYRGHPEKQMVSLLINVSWGTEYIPEILKTLKDQNVKATFFIEGKWAKENVEYVKMIHEQGHTIGNHAYNHPDMARLSRAEIVKQIQDTNEVIKAITNETPKWFAPPSGSFNQEVVQVAEELDMYTILWSVDTIDWKNPTVDVMMNRVMNKIHPGATILMHPTPVIANGLPNLIHAIKEKQYEIGTINKLLSETR